jgi:hypothetical protein
MKGTAQAHESQTIGKEDLRKVQDYQKTRPDNGHL